TAPWDTVHHGNFCAVGYHNPKREKVSGPMGSNPGITFGRYGKRVREGANKSYGTRAFTGNPLILND
ncbi:hypothetical protein ACSZMM_22160, partial [Aeromonas caviae]|uniref:hypothetical protein n=1 Tax=Aeromonas caviae TaxID=648 RepID=UPI003EC5D54C